MTSAVEAAPRAPQGAPFRAVLLDLDGCVIDSNQAHTRAWSVTLARFGRKVSAARLRGGSRPPAKAWRRRRPAV